MAKKQQQGITVRRNSTAGMGPASSVQQLKKLADFCLDQFQDGQIKGFRMIIDIGEDPMDDISIGSLAP